MAAGADWFPGFVEAETEADRVAGDNPGLVVWVIEGWGSLSRYEDGEDGEDIHVIWAETEEEAQDQVDLFAWAAWENQYDATKQKEPADG